MVAAAPAAAAAMRKSFLVPEIKPLDQYDFSRARSAASLAWVLAKGYGGAAHPLNGNNGLASVAGSWAREPGWGWQDQRWLIAGPLLQMAAP
ncbi:UNVERIFIED_CONTAM: hypothetical protein K2H54_003368 [Gekko kuhli]